MNVQAGRVYRHYKGNRYLALGVAIPVADSIPVHLEVGEARHSETGAVCTVGILNNLWVARFNPQKLMPPIEPLVVYVPLYDVGSGQPIAVRPVRMWDEQVPLETAYSTSTVTRFSLEV